MHQLFNKVSVGFKLAVNKINYVNNNQTTVDTSQVKSYSQLIPNKTSLNPATITSNANANSKAMAIESEGNSIVQKHLTFNDVDKYNFSNPLEYGSYYFMQRNTRVFSQLYNSDLLYYLMPTDYDTPEHLAQYTSIVSNSKNER